MKLLFLVSLILFHSNSVFANEVPLNEKKVDVPQAESQVDPQAALQVESNATTLSDPQYSKATICFELGIAWGMAAVNYVHLTSSQATDEFTVKSLQLLRDYCAGKVNADLGAVPTDEEAARILALSVLNLSEQARLQIQKQQQNNLNNAWKSLDLSL